MLRHKDTMIIAVDHGYGNIKTANTVTHTGIAEYDSRPVFSGNILEYEGIWYRIGEQHKEFIPDKAADEDYFLLTLYAIARELHREHLTEANVHLACGLPLTWVRTQRETFRRYLTQKEELSFSCNDVNYHIRITGCSIFPQGYPAIINHLDEFRGINMLADIGNGTMNIMYINNKQPMENRCWTEKLGVNQCMIRAKNAVMDKFGVRIDDAIIEQVFRYGTADIGEEYLDCIRSIAEGYVSELFATLRKYDYDPDLMKLYVIGGGACLLRHFGTYDTARVEIIDDICATAKGYEQLALMLLRKEA
ncbi:MAG: ParM/StbA family protein [Firmicutes bacterium]|nr:ParM/StbA family protein [Bacillota bacterium]